MWPGMVYGSRRRVNRMTSNWIVSCLLLCRFRHFLCCQRRHFEGNQRCYACCQHGRRRMDDSPNELRFILLFISRIYTQTLINYLPLAHLHLITCPHSQISLFAHRCKKREKKKIGRKPLCLGSDTQNVLTLPQCY